ncbi:TlyA family RNA methyltransferase [Candidatus Aminicenantes bacterium AC-708-M15]|jgi:23S rRNA (cytidine1920-2'-O)/16S rRNA (cytidine1409-2'-O)-methyltransferase|nr:TlyA family RNA methyltransferase [SCandidatus Aminicenantes bacterium Aminicenantia_JdfR_composite]MCP2597068.1 TlyA family RNA methyltransferase [Candidatus Aminicenantes bacterium AC-335-G13]MCP2598668.1 TlyA family RNA methyltransferase [Candidatus Aminicenantes bacterium AC-335-L06]MCP2599002.1 TlyA family RNA methyltransferase [Candidatus Aminicenantes bacterium AC-335-B20]MCP2604184.1 TlyA family RNA methyltransferase [Candidatus Aminicenantes bacterium AC-708-M15]MCP2605475.1 TlyA f
MVKERADLFLLKLGLTESREKAKRLILAGEVFANGKRIEKPGEKIDISAKIEIKNKLPYVSRGGVKLEKALEDFKISPENKIVADIGSSTGGFTDCLLQRGAKVVYAIDVDTKQLDWNLRRDSRVILIEKNARYLEKSDFKHEIDLVTIDVSFISVLKILPAIKKIIKEDGEVISLIKPQFEAGKERVGKGGIVKDKNIHKEVLEKIIGEAESIGFYFHGLTKSPIKGQKGNIEYFILWRLNSNFYFKDQIKEIIKKVVSNE